MTRAAQAVPSATCHCGSVRIRVRRAPRTVTRCNCSICRRYGALWAYYGASAVQIEAPKGGLSSRGAARFAPSFAARDAVASRTTSTGRDGVAAASQSMPPTSRPRCSGESAFASSMAPPHGPGNTRHERPFAQRLVQRPGWCSDRGLGAAAIHRASLAKPLTERLPWLPHSPTERSAISSCRPSTSRGRPPSTPRCSAGPCASGAMAPPRSMTLRVR